MQMHGIASKAWAHMVLHLPHAEGGFGVTFNDITKDAAFYNTTSRFVAWLGAFLQNVTVCGCPRGPSRMVLTPACDPPRHPQRPSGQVRV